MAKVAGLTDPSCLLGQADVGEALCRGEALNRHEVRFLGVIAPPPLGVC
jgi:hypothetical protein